MAEEKDKSQRAGGKSVVSLVLLVVILVAIFFLAPRLQEFLDNQSTDEASNSADVESVEPKQIQSGNAPNKAPSALKDWIPLVEQQFSKDDTTKVRLLYLRLSDDKSTLLLDLELTEEDETERFDLILERDKFGRYISDNEALPIKLYPPEDPPVKVEKVEKEEKADSE